jgi:putative phosphoesterase
MALIGLISDVHETPEPLKEALSIFASRGVEQVFCAGDIAGYGEDLHQTIKILQANECQTILGNHDLLYLDHHEEEPDNRSVQFLKQLPTFIEQVIEGKRLYMVHAQPPDECNGGIKLLSKEGDVLEERVEIWAEKLRTFYCDVLVVGHTHQVFVEKIGNTLVVNPGSSVFNHCCAILKLPEMTVEMVALSGKSIVKTWNWGDHVIHGN